MKIALIDPAFEEAHAVGGSKSIEKVLNVIPSLGLAYIGAVLERAGHKVEIYDCTIGMPYAELMKKLNSYQPEIIGITGTTPASSSMFIVSEKIRKDLPDTIILVGGAHLNALPEETMKHGCFDIGVLGEGEITVVEMIKHIKDHGLKNLNRIAGIVYREDNHIRMTKPRPLIKDLDQLPFPARHLLPPLSAYSPTPASLRRRPLGVMITSRGCPSNCTFCDRAIFGSTYRMRSAGNVLDEVEELINKYGAREIRFFDDCMTLNKRRIFEICDEFEKRKINIPWTCLTKVNAVTKEMLDRMKQVGCWQVLYGLESGDPRMLKLLNKGTTVEQNKKAIRWAKEVGLSVRGDFIVGTPGDTLGSMEKTLDFAVKMNLDYAHFNKFVPLPGTKLYRDLINEGYNFNFFKSSILDHSALLYVPEGIDEKTYRGFLDTAYKKFYLRPSYILKRLLQLRSVEQFKDQIIGFFAIRDL